MIIDTYTVNGVTFDEFPLIKYLRFTEYSWYVVGVDNSLLLLPLESSSYIEQAYQRRLRARE